MSRTALCPRSGSDAFGARGKHAHDIGYDFRCLALLAVTLVLPLSRLQSAFHVDEHALLEILLGNLGELAPENNAVPFCAFLTLAAAALERFVCGKCEIRYRLAARGVARFWVAPKAAYKNHFVDGHEQEYSPKYGDRKRRSPGVARPRDGTKHPRRPSLPDRMRPSRAYQPRGRSR